MEWLAENWIIVALLGGMVGIHLVGHRRGGGHGGGHGCCGGGGHSDGEKDCGKKKPNAEDEASG